MSAPVLGPERLREISPSAAPRMRCGDSPGTDKASLAPRACDPCWNKSQKKTAARRRPFTLGTAKPYFFPPVLGLPDAGPAPELAPPGVPKVPLGAVAPAPAGDDGVPATWRSPRTSMSTRLSGCRHWISFSPLTPLHWSPVTGSLLPRPSALILLVSTPLWAR